MSAASKGLGKGLSALMAEDYSHETPDAVAGDVVTSLPLSDLVSGKYQPRRHFDEDALKELADSIRSNGVMQPILVRPLAEKRDGASYEIIAGERRWRASKLAGLNEVPVLIREMEDRKALEMALIENIQRQDLSSLEESEGYQQLMDGFSYTQEELSRVVGKSRSHIANSLRLLSLPQAVKEHLSRGDISAGHARALLQAEKPEELVGEIVRRGLNVRQTENIARAGGLPPKDMAEEEVLAGATKAATAPRPAREKTSPVMVMREKDPDIVALEETLQGHLGMAISIDDEGDKGSVTIRYASLAQLDSLLKRLGGAF